MSEINNILSVAGWFVGVLFLGVVAFVVLYIRNLLQREEQGE